MTGCQKVALAPGLLVDGLSCNDCHVLGAGAMIALPLMLHVVAAGDADVVAGATQGLGLHRGLGFASAPDLASALARAAAEAADGSAAASPAAAADAQARTDEGAAAAETAVAPASGAASVATAYLADSNDSSSGDSGAAADRSAFAQQGWLQKLSLLEKEQCLFSLQQLHCVSKAAIISLNCHSFSTSKTWNLFSVSRFTAPW